jgi:predicted transcriptional regulator
MSETAKVAYDKDLALFYQTFTGKPMSSMSNDNIHNFRDIKINTYSNYCGGINAKYTRKVSGNKTDPLIIQYAENLKTMLKNADEKQRDLFDILDKIFGYTEDKMGKKQIRIKPNLKEEDLSYLIKDTRELLINLYIGCELNYANGIKIYEAIIDKQILETTQNQLKTLETTSHELVSS